MVENVSPSFVEQFICRLYGVTQTTSVDTSRHIFSGRGKPENLPPTSDTLSFPVKRSHYQVMIWHDVHYDTTAASYRKAPFQHFVSGHPL